MKPRIAAVLLAVGLAASAAAAAEEASDAPIRFELCGRMATVELGEFGGPEPHVVLIQLEDEDGERFAKLTRENVGRTLEITHAGHPLLRAPIQGEIRSGLVNATYATREDAEGLRAALRDASRCASQGGEESR